MLEKLKPILEIQELDIKMIRLMRLKKQRKGELTEIDSLRAELQEQLESKQEEVNQFDQEISSFEQKIDELTAKLKKLEDQQSLVKKVDEFNAMTQEMTALERERLALEQNASNLLDKKVTEEEILAQIKASLEESQSSSTELEKEITSSIETINHEGLELKTKRDALAAGADKEVLAIYEKLLRNRKDRVVVPLVNRICMGCNVQLTLQHENLVRKGENIVFCEHCARIHYWPDAPEAESAGVVTKQRRRRSSVTTS